MIPDPTFVGATSTVPRLTIIKWREGFYGVCAFVDPGKFADMMALSMSYHGAYEKIPARFVEALVQASFSMP